MTRNDPPATDHDPTGRKRGVSPVVGVVLLVAITLLLATVVGVYFSTLAQPPTTEPEVDFGFAYNYDCFGPDDFEVVHRGGDDIDPSRTYAVLDGTSTSFAELGASGKFTAGNKVVVSKAVDSEYPVDMMEMTLRIVWVNPESDESFVLETFEIPRACVGPALEAGGR
jgi:flagellin-like protein